MKIIHCADIHLGSPISTLPREIAEERRNELRLSFERMVEYAQKDNISVILLSGDVFDRDRPFKKDLDFFYGAVKKAEKIDFLYLRGNHDLDGIPEELPNLKTFSENWTAYRYGDVTICGIELSNNNSDSYYSTLSLDPEAKNIVMLHGQIGSEINVSRLRDKHIDYLALGHIHSYSSGELDRRGKYAYSGCLEGRGFDETGEKGFVIIDTDGAVISHAFNPFSLKVIEEHHVDVSGLMSTYEIYSKIKDTVNLQKNGIYCIILTGETDKQNDGLESEIKTYLTPWCGHVSVKDETAVKINYEDYENDVSLRGEFIRTVQANVEYTEEEKAVIINYGLKALSGERPE